MSVPSYITYIQNLNDEYLVEIVKDLIGLRMTGCLKPGDTVCGKEACALWNERKNRCGLICKLKSAPKEKKQ